MTRPAHGDGTDCIFVANIESREHPPIADVIREHRPALVLLQQANRFTTAFGGYSAVGYRFSFEARGIKALVRDDVKVVRKKALKMRRRWIGPKAGRWHDGRDYLALLTKIDGQKAWDIDVHLPTHNNPEAQAESLRRLARFVKRRRRPVRIWGDFNMEHDELVAWADSIGASVVSFGKVDHGVLRGTKVRRVDRRLAPSGFHGWGVVKFDTKEK